MIPIQGVSANQLINKSTNQQIISFRHLIIWEVSCSLFCGPTGCSKLYRSLTAKRDKSQLCHCLQKCNNPQRICCTVYVHCGVCNTKKLYKQHPTTTTAASPEVISPRSILKHQVPNPCQWDERVYYSQYTEQIFYLSLDDVITTGWCSASFKSVCIKRCDSFLLREEAREFNENNNKIKNIKRVMPWQSFQPTSPQGKIFWMVSLLIVIYPAGGGIMSGESESYYTGTWTNMRSVF